MLRDKNPLVSPNSHQQFKFPKTGGLVPRGRDELPSALQPKRRISREGYFSNKDPSFPPMTGSKLNLKSQNKLSPVPTAKKIRKRSNTDPIPNLHPSPMRRGKQSADKTPTTKTMAAPPVDFGRSSLVRHVGPFVGRILCIV